MPASTGDVRKKAKSLRGALAAPKRSGALHRLGGAAAPVRQGSPVHALHERLRDAFAIQSPPRQDPPTPMDLAVRQARAIHRANVEGVRAAILDGDIAPAEAASWITRDVETCIASMLGAVLHDLEGRHGPCGGVAVLGLGKLGGGELSLGSDVDLIFVCESAGDDDGPLQQAAVAMAGALAWRPDAGPLYDLDMRLRPFGPDGPLATPYTLFDRYYRAERWTWELQALLRARVIGDDSAFGRRLAQSVFAALQGGPDPAAVLAETAEMRRLMARENPPKGPWDLKRVSGGLADLEFIVQGLQLAHGVHAPEVLQPSTLLGLQALEDAGALPTECVHVLAEVFDLYSTVRQLQGAVNLPGQDLRLAPKGHHEAVLIGLGAFDWPDLRRRLASARTEVRRIFRQVFGVSSSPRLA